MTRSRTPRLSMRVLAPAFLAALALAPGLSSAARAACAGQTFLSCDTGRNRHLEVCIQPGESKGEGVFTYAFGPKGKPDLKLSEPFSALTVAPWNGVGRAIWETVAFRNGDYAYEAWHSLDRMVEDPPLEGGVNVMKGEDLVASLTCRPGPDTVIAPVFALADAMEAAGYCHDLETGAWRLAPEKAAENGGYCE